MKPKPEDLSLVLRVANLISASKLGKATVRYLTSRLNLGSSDEYAHLTRILKKYFKKDGWSRQDFSSYYIPRADLKLPEPDLSIPPEDPPEEVVKPAFCPGTHASHSFEALEREEAKRDEERERREKM